MHGSNVKLRGFRVTIFFPQLTKKEEEVNILFDYFKHCITK